MKADKSTPQTIIPRRSWLGALATGLAAIPALRWLGGGQAKRLAHLADGRPAPGATASRPAVRPCPDSVKRHG